MTAAQTLEPGKLDIGQVIQQTFAVVGRNFMTFFVLSLILVGIPNVVVSALQLGRLSEGDFNFDANSILLWVVSIVANAVLQGALIYATVQDLNSSKPTIGESLATGLRAFLPLIGLSILMGIAVTFGLVLLVVPGVMLACAWCVAVPSLVAERRGVFDSFGRSAELTRHNRWRIFGVFLVYIAIAVVVSMVVAIAGGIGSIVSGGSTSPVVLVLNALVSAVLGMVGSAGVAVLYVELRHAREGSSPQWLAEIFS